MKKILIYSCATLFLFITFFVAGQYTLVHADQNCVENVGVCNPATEVCNPATGVCEAVNLSPATNPLLSGIGTVIDIVNYILIFLDGLAVLVFVFGLVRYLYLIQTGGEDARKDARGYMISGIIIFVIIAGFYGIINIAADTFGLTGGQFQIPQATP